jgi:ABC-2 type transport system ATP-binding protein
VPDPVAVRRCVSLTGQDASVDEELTGRETLLLLGRLLGHGTSAARRRPDELLEAFGLTDAADRLVSTYSGGMRRRLDIASSIVVTPELLFLDEPTTGLDPRSRNQVWDIVRALVAAGTTVLLTTQYLDEADQLASRIAIIDQGRKITEGTPGELKASVGSAALHLRLADPADRTDAAPILAAALDTEVHPGDDPSALTASVGDGAAAQVAAAIAELASAGVTVSSFTVGQPSLDEVFLALTGHPAEPDSDPASDPEGAAA